MGHEIEEAADEDEPHQEQVLDQFFAMPKCRRFTNLLKSSPQPKRGFDQSNEDIVHNSLTNSSPPNHDSIMQGNPDSTTDHSLPNQGSQEHTWHFGGHQSSEYWQWRQ
ncbi:uncharacterized protein DS421_12g368010 [Arachis hypogaea]|nr:uncharacterized protein DS421_12g368010 [Arachis hypogaea]